MSTILKNKCEQNFVEIYQLIDSARKLTFKHVNTNLISLYWNLGAYLSKKVNMDDWGQDVVGELARYISFQDPNLKGFSARNLWRMKQFYETYKDISKLSAVLTELPKAKGHFKDSYVFEFLNLNDNHNEPDLAFR